MIAFEKLEEVVEERLQSYVDRLVGLWFFWIIEIRLSFELYVSIGRIFIGIACG